MIKECNKADVARKKEKSVDRGQALVSVSFYAKEIRFLEVMYIRK